MEEQELLDMEVKKARLEKEWNRRLHEFQTNQGKVAERWRMSPQQKQQLQQQLQQQRQQRQQRQQPQPYLQQQQLEALPWAGGRDTFDGEDKDEENEQVLDANNKGIRVHEALKKLKKLTEDSRQEIPSITLGRFFKDINRFNNYLIYNKGSRELSVTHVGVENGSRYVLIQSKKNEGEPKKYKYFPNRIQQPPLKTDNSEKSKIEIWLVSDDGKDTEKYHSYHDPEGILLTFFEAIQHDDN